MCYLRNLLAGLALCVVSFLAGGLFVARQDRVAAELVIYQTRTPGTDKVSTLKTQNQNRSQLPLDSALNNALGSTDETPRHVFNPGGKEELSQSGQLTQRLQPGEPLAVEVRFLEAQVPAVTSVRSGSQTKVQWGTATPYPFNVLNRLVDQLQNN